MANTKCVQTGTVLVYNAQHSYTYIAQSSIYTALIGTYTVQSGTYSACTL